MNTKSTASITRKGRTLGLKNFEMITIRQLLQNVSEDVVIPVSRVWLNKIGVKAAQLPSSSSQMLTPIPVQAEKEEKSSVHPDLVAAIELLVSQIQKLPR
jgi:hypothetical protein